MISAACRSSITAFTFSGALRARRCNCGYTYCFGHITSPGFSTSFFILMLCLVITVSIYMYFFQRFSVYRTVRHWKHWSLTSVPTASPIDLSGSYLCCWCRHPRGLGAAELPKKRNCLVPYALLQCFCTAASLHINTFSSEIPLSYGLFQVCN